MQIRKLNRNLNKSNRTRLTRSTWYLLRRGKRRRQSHSVEPPAVTGLQAGLTQFYQGAAGLTHLRSWNETETVPDNPFAGMPSLYSGAGGAYQAGDIVFYTLLPYRETGGRIYAGASRRLTYETGSDESILWDPWWDTPGWITGYTLLRWVNGAYAGFRDLTAAAMFAGWSDDASGWSAPALLPFNYGAPPTVAKVLWHVLDEFSDPQELFTAAWSGGTAFNAGAANTHLVRFINDDLRRSLSGTLAFWIQPMEEGVVAAVRGQNDFNFQLRCAGSGEGFEFGDEGEVFMDGHQPGDWYLLVLRNDADANTLTIDALRQRDLAHGTATLTMPGYCRALEGGSDYLTEGIGSVLSIGGPWFAESLVGIQCDRIGLWDRPLSNAEVLELFDNGNGWLPG